MIDRWAELHTQHHSCSGISLVFISLTVRRIPSTNISRTEMKFYLMWSHEDQIKCYRGRFRPHKENLSLKSELGSNLLLYDVNSFHEDPIECKEPGTENKRRVTGISQTLDHWRRFNKSEHGVKNSLKSFHHIFYRFVLLSPHFYFLSSRDTDQSAKSMNQYLLA